MFSPIIEKNFFSFFSGSQCVITMFPLSSQHVIHSNSLFPYASANVALLSPIQLGQRAETQNFKIEPSTVGASIVFFFCMMTQSNWLVAKNINKTWEARHLINMRGEQIGELWLVNQKSSFSFIGPCTVKVSCAYFNMPEV